MMAEAVGAKWKNLHWLHQRDSFLFKTYEHFLLFPQKRMFWAIHYIGCSISGTTRQHTWRFSQEAPGWCNESGRQGTWHVWVPIHLLECFIALHHCKFFHPQIKCILNCTTASFSLQVAQPFFQVSVFVLCYIF